MKICELFVNWEDRNVIVKEGCKYYPLSLMLAHILIEGERDLGGFFYLDGSICKDLEGYDPISTEMFMDIVDTEIVLGNL